MKHYCIEVRYQAAAGRRGDFLREVESIADRIRKEEGCLRYDYVCPEEVPDLIVLHEEWESAGHQQAHLKQPHMAALKELKAKYILRTEIITR